MLQKKPIAKPNNNKNSLLRKDFYKRLFYIGLCIIPIYLFGNDTGTFRLVPLPFFLIAGYHLMIIIKLSQTIIDDFFPPKTLFEKTSIPLDTFVYYFASTLFFVGLVALLIEIKFFENTIRGTNLFWKGGGIGVALAILFTLVLKVTNPSIYFESKRRYTVHFGLFVGLFLLSAATAGFINHYYANQNIFCKSYGITRKDISNGRRSTEYFIYVKFTDTYEERFSIGQKRYENFNEGEQIELCMIKGKLGYDYVKDFNKLEK